jgi:hypothetical protein
MANNPTHTESFHEIPASKYWWLPGDIAVPKDLFKFWSLLSFGLGSSVTAVALLTNWWQLLFRSMFLGQLWTVGWIVLPLCISITYFWLKKQSAQRKADLIEANRLKRYQDAVITQNEGVKKRRK